MTFDVIFVTYNSSKWIENCFTSILKSNYSSDKLNIIVVDNASTDNTVKLLEDYKEKNGASFNSFTIIKEQQNLGFGKANNIGFKAGKSDAVCFFNIDTEIFEDTFDELSKAIDKSDETVGVWELRQFPYEHPKLYDALTGETTWVSGAAFVVRRKVFEKVNGFDEKIFMYAEDVDLSWRIRAEGYKLIYVPRAKITHYSYESAGEVKPNQHVNSVINNLLLRHRYGTFLTVANGYYQFMKVMCRTEAFQGARRLLLKGFINHFSKIYYFRMHGKYRNSSVRKFLGWDYEIIRDGAFFENKLPDKKPLVSIIVRTCGRPSVLRETLISLRNQTYDNFQVVIVEDGANVSEEMIRNGFSDLNILYKATGDKVGRSKAGNMAMAMAEGEYLNFLDDDDLFFADHIEVLVELIQKDSNLAAYTTAFETPITVKSKNPYVYEIRDYECVHTQEFNKVILCHHNYIPIQCIMFSKKLFDEYGGFDESVDALEDWDMWLRYSLHTDFSFFKKTTSIYRVPAERQVNKQRQKALDDALFVMREKHKGYEQKISVYDICKMYESR